MVAAHLIQDRIGRRSARKSRQRFTTVSRINPLRHMVIFITFCSIFLLRPTARSHAIPTASVTCGTHEPVQVASVSDTDLCEEIDDDGVGERSRDEWNDTELSSSMRGGGQEGVDEEIKSVIRHFLDSSANEGMEEFYVQGWRWHTMSLVRDSVRIENLANRVLPTAEFGPGAKALGNAAEWLVQFNMAGLHRIESGVFNPWLRKYLCDETAVELFCESKDKRNIVAAFGVVIDRLDDYRRQSAKLGNDLHERAKKVSNPSISLHQRREAIKELAQIACTLSKLLQRMRRLQENLIVPSVARVVTSGTQKSFNNKVLRKLGLLESRVHLVGMRDAVWESGNDSEMAKFETDIPYVARMMIERWRTSLYAPKAGGLDYGLDQ